MRPLTREKIMQDWREPSRLNDDGRDVDFSWWKNKHEKKNKPIIIVSELDPYGEEDWDN